MKDSPRLFISGRGYFVDPGYSLRICRPGCGNNVAPRLVGNHCHGTDCLWGCTDLAASPAVAQIPEEKRCRANG